MKPIVLLIQLAVGSGYTQSFDTMAACEKARRAHVERYQQTHVVTASGCFPRALVEHAAKGQR